MYVRAKSPGRLCNTQKQRRRRRGGIIEKDLDEIRVSSGRAMVAVRLVHTLCDHYLRVYCIYIYCRWVSCKPLFWPRRQKNRAGVL